METDQITMIKYKIVIPLKSSKVKIKILKKQGLN